VEREPELCVYRAHPLITGAAVLAGAIAGFMGYSLWQTGDMSSAFFFLLSLGLTIGIGLSGRATLILTEDRLIYRIPLWRTYVIELRQLADVEEAGRHSQALLLYFHPLDERGGVDQVELRALGLLPLDDQADLRERLESVLPTGQAARKQS